jgi:glycosyltransferase involved in cell wall biosynthesis
MRQTYTNIEIIVVDDASCDTSELDRIPIASNIRILKLQKQIGPSGARNAGFQQSRGEYIQYLDCDDFIHPSKIETQVRALLKSTAQMALSNWRIANRIFNIDFNFPVCDLAQTENFLAETIADTHKWFPIMCGLQSRSLLADVGNWNEELVWNEDRDFRYRILKMNPRVVFTPHIFFTYRRHNSRSSRNTAPRYTQKGRMVMAQIDREFIEMVQRDVDSGVIGGAEVLNGLDLARSKLDRDLLVSDVTQSKLKTKLKEILGVELAHRISATQFMLKNWLHVWLVHFLKG